MTSLLQGWSEAVIAVLSTLEPVTLGWDENPEPTVTSYRVEQRMPDETWAPVAEVVENQATVQAQDGAVFRVVAVGLAVESPPSQPIQVLRLKLEKTEDFKVWEVERNFWVGVDPEARAGFWRVAR